MSQAGKAVKTEAESQASQPAVRLRSKQGQGLDPNKLSRMLGNLKYNAGNAKKVDEEKKNVAQEALKVYKSLEDLSDKADFLNQYEENGMGKTAKGLAFATTFT